MLVQSPYFARFMPRSTPAHTVAWLRTLQPTGLCKPLVLAVLLRALPTADGSGGGVQLWKLCTTEKCLPVMHGALHRQGIAEPGGADVCMMIDSRLGARLRTSVAAVHSMIS